MSHESLAGSPGELREGAETASRSHGILQHAPAAFAWVEMGPTMGQGQPWLWSPLPRLAVRGRSTRPPPVPGRTQPGSKRPFDLTQPEVLCRLSDLQRMPTETLFIPFTVRGLTVPLASIKLSPLE